MEIQYKIKPWEHQLVAIDLARERNFFALFFQMGCGKTCVAINTLRHKYREAGRVFETLILCPLIVVENWRREIETHAGGAVFKKVQVLEGDSKKKLKQLERAGDARRVFITNIDTINTDFWKRLTSARQWRGLIVDESQKFKDPRAKRTKKLHRFSDRVRDTKLILSGSPILNSPMDAWAQLRILSRDIFGDNFVAFRAEFFEDVNKDMPASRYYPDWQPKPNSIERLRSILEQHSMRVTKEEVMHSLPPLVRQTVYVELSREQRKMYDEMAQNLITYINGRAVVAEIALTKMLRLQQLTVGIAKTDTGETLRFPSAKPAALRDLLEDICPQSKSIVWTNFVDTYNDVQAVCDDLKLNAVRLVGGQTKGRQEMVDAFNTDPNVHVMIANQAAGGVGIGLQAASYAIYYSKTYSLEQDQQSESRNHRGGSEVHERITRIDIVAQNTLDEDVTAVLAAKANLGELLLRFRRRHGRADGLGSEEIAIVGGVEGDSSVS